MADAETFMTVTEIARRLHLPASTVRHWRDVYRDLFGERTNAEGQRVYPLATFMEIERLHRQRRSSHDVREILAQRVPGGESPDATLADVVAALDRLTVAVNRLADRLDARQGGEP